MGQEATKQSADLPGDTVQNVYSLINEEDRSVFPCIARVCYNHASRTMTVYSPDFMHKLQTAQKMEWVTLLQAIHIVDGIPPYPINSIPPLPSWNLFTGLKMVTVEAHAIWTGMRMFTRFQSFLTALWSVVLYAPSLEHFIVHNTHSNTPMNYAWFYMPEGSQIPDGQPLRKLHLPLMSNQDPYPAHLVTTLERFGQLQALTVRLTNLRSSATVPHAAYLGVGSVMLPAQHLSAPTLNGMLDRILNDNRNQLVGLEVRDGDNIIQPPERPPYPPRTVLLHVRAVPSRVACDVWLKALARMCCGCSRVLVRWCDEDTTFLPDLVEWVDAPETRVVLYSAEVPDLPNTVPIMIPLGEDDSRELRHFLFDDLDGNLVGAFWPYHSYREMLA